MTFITTSLSVQLITISILSLQRQIAHNRNVIRNEWNNNYDYIVVGSGSAGAVIANRLTEDRNINVLLLEAGGAQNNIADMTGLAPSLVGTEADWQYRTVPQRRLGQAFRNRTLAQPKGKIIGGTSTINWMLYNRGNRRSYDAWANTYGADGWTYDDVLPYFRR